MKVLKLSLIAVMAILTAVALSGVNAYAFHDGGVATCDGCHTMHNSYKGTKMTVNNLPIGTANAYLLKGQDQSSTCLNCHRGTPGSYHIMTTGAITSTTVPTQYTPGGDFGWLLITTSALATYGAPVNNPGERHGHNIIAADFGLVQDAIQTAAPGGTYAAANLGCQSCHDPHGKTRLTTAGTYVTPSIGTAVLSIGASGSYGELPTADYAVGAYRLLGGTGYVPKSYAGGPAFTANPPIAVAPSTYNRSESVTDTRVAYGQGMSEWCANCHTQMHNDAYPTNLRHPAGNGADLTAAIVTNYNAYVKSGDLTGTIATAYSSMIPFEEGSADLATLATHAVIDGSQKGGAAATNNVACVSCHRAHATGFESISRWCNNTEFLTIDGEWPGTDAPTTEGKGGQYNRGYTQAQYQAAMYDRPASNYAFFQRSLCNKCHAKD